MRQYTPERWLIATLSGETNKVVGTIAKTYADALAAMPGDTRHAKLSEGLFGLAILEQREVTHVMVPKAPHQIEGHAGSLLAKRLFATEDMRRIGKAPYVTPQADVAIRLPHRERRVGVSFSHANEAVHDRVEVGIGSKGNGFVNGGRLWIGPDSSPRRYAEAQQGKLALAGIVTQAMSTVSEMAVAQIASSLRRAGALFDQWELFREPRDESPAGTPFWMQSTLPSLAEFAAPTQA